MKIVRGFDKNGFKKWKSVITIGGFDGIHIGHEAILERLCDLARSHEGKGIVVTFDPLPKEFFRREEFRLITTTDEKLAILEEFGVDGVFMIPFTTQFSRLEAANFLDRIWNYFNPRGIVVGHNHHFGRDCKGGISLLRRFSREMGIDLNVVKEVTVNNTIVSSTQIRKLIDQGHIKRANKMLGREFSFAATVTRGKGIGKALSFPTANLSIGGEKKLLPKVGVYAAKAILNGDEYGAMLYLGKRPTFYRDGRESIEAYIMGFKGDLYGKKMTVKVIERIREEKKFSSPRTLKHQIMDDEVTARKIIESMTANQGG